MQTILHDRRFAGNQFRHLMPQQIGIVAQQTAATAAARFWLSLDRCRLCPRCPLCFFAYMGCERLFWHCCAASAALMVLAISFEQLACVGVVADYA